MAYKKMGNIWNQLQAIVAPAAVPANPPAHARRVGRNAGHARTRYNFRIVSNLALRHSARQGIRHPLPPICEVCGMRRRQCTCRQVMVCLLCTQIVVRGYGCPCGAIVQCQDLNNGAQCAEWADVNTAQGRCPAHGGLAPPTGHATLRAGRQAANPAVRDPALLAAERHGQGWRLRRNY
jgi:hypothetical protein